MMIPFELQESPVARKVRMCRNTRVTAMKLKERLNHFLKDVDRHRYLTKKEKEEIKNMLLK